MNKYQTAISKWQTGQFETSTATTRQFKSFTRDYILYIKKTIEKEYPDLELAGFSIGHFYLTGFIRSNKTGKYAYFSISDVRYFPNDWYNSVLYRTAEHIKDYTGGSNNYAALPDLLARINSLINS